MARLNKLRGVLPNFLGAYTGRSSEYDGYWLFGFLVSRPTEWAVDLLGAPPGEGECLPEAVAARIAIARFGEQLTKAGLAASDLLEARLDVSMSPPRRGSSMSSRRRGPEIVTERDGHDVRFVVRARTRAGRDDRSERSIFVAPHDPRFERRSTRKSGRGDQGSALLGSSAPESRPRSKVWRIVRRVAGLLLLVLLVLFGRPVGFLLWVWLHDSSSAPPPTAVGTNDAGGLDPTVPLEVVAVASDRAAAEQQLVSLVQRAAKEHLHISIRGSGHSMGGHTLYPGGIALDMRPFAAMSLDAERSLLHVGAGARWAEIIPFLDRAGKSVAVMQSNSDFTVGGSISVNCHGWQLGAPPIASTVVSFRLVTADGRTLTCSRTENPRLFSLALGGYGLFGVILDVELRVVPNEFYRASSSRVKPSEYARTYDERTHGRTDLGMAYGRISAAPSSFLDDAMVVVLQRADAGRSAADTLAPVSGVGLKRAVFRACVGSDYGKDLRWRLEEWVGETGGDLLSRNQILNEPADLYGCHDASEAETLEEYFVPKGRLGEFVEKAKPVFAAHHPDLLNITVREVEADPDSFLAYAREDVFGLVMLFHQKRDAASESAMAARARDLIDVVLDCGGTYYLPYRPHATVAQFERGYPRAREFVREKRSFDPDDVFSSRFFETYGRPLLDAPQGPK